MTTTNNAEQTEREAQIRERLSKATPGPWEHRLDSNYKKEPHAGSIWQDAGGYWLAKIEDDGPNDLADAELIANAPADLQFLLSELSSVRSALERAEQDAKRLDWLEKNRAGVVLFDDEPPMGFSAVIAGTLRPNGDCFATVREAIDAAMQSAAAKSAVAGASSLGESSHE